VAAVLRPERVFPGTCAWSFDDWRDAFYPHPWPRNRWLEFYARHFPAVEMDSSFYHVPSAKTVAHWAGMTPPTFRFCPKLPKTLSHEKRLEEPAPEINMMRHLADELGGRFGCALLQLPPAFHARPHEEKTLRSFLRSWPAEVPLAVEFRHESWNTPHAAGMLEERGVAWVWADNLPLEAQAHAGFGFRPVTAKHLYVRLLGDFRTKYGPDGKETHRYGKLLWPRDTALEHWAVKLRHQTEAAAIYVFANNHYEGMAVETVRRLARKVGLDLPAAESGAGLQLELFEGEAAG
jgi:uncharacterized protein YecE (DUF72 family)